LIGGLSTGFVNARFVVFEEFSDEIESNDG
jgi:hypothetical protein